MQRKDGNINTGDRENNKTMRTSILKSDKFHQKLGPRCGWGEMV